MPRKKILRAKDGSKPEKFKRGEENTNIEVSVTYSTGLNFDKTDEQIIWETASGQKDLHQTSKARNIPNGSKGYIHNYSTNTLWAVKRLDPKKYTIEIIAEGKVNSGKHVF